MTVQLRKDREEIQESIASTDHCDGGSSLVESEDVLDVQELAQQTHIRQVAPSMLCYRGARWQDGRGQALSDIYELEHELGSGASSTIYMAVDKRTGEKRAVKVVHRDNFAEGYDLETDDETPFESEMQALQATDHPNIVRLFDAFQSPGFDALAIELCPGGNLLDYLTACDQLFGEQTTAVATRQVGSALVHLHGLQICHCDLKPENILVVGESPDSCWHGCPVLKVADFGVSTIKCRRSVAVGCSSYAAPEVLNLNAPCDQSGDIWSLGMVALFLLSGTDADTLRAIILEHGVIPEIQDVSDIAHDCIGWCLDLDPILRGSASSVLRHEWLTEVACQEQLSEQADVLASLQQFRQLTKSQRAIIQIMAYAMPADQLCAQSAAFVALTADSGCALSLHEMRSFECVHRDCQDRAAVANVISFGQTESVCYHEFVAASLHPEQYMQDDTLWLTFCAIDVDGKGSISRHNLQELLHNTTTCDSSADTWIEQWFVETNVDCNGDMDFAHFCELMRLLKESITSTSD